MHLVGVNTLEHNDNVDSLQTNEIAKVSIKTQRPLIYDAYQDNRATTGFIIIDQETTVRWRQA